jgi:hypothetical protein
MQFFLRKHGIKKTVEWNIWSFGKIRTSDLELVPCKFLQKIRRNEDFLRQTKIEGTKPCMHIWTKPCMHIWIIKEKWKKKILYKWTHAVQGLLWLLLFSIMFVRLTYIFICGCNSFFFPLAGLRFELRTLCMIGESCCQPFFQSFVCVCVWGGWYWSLNSGPHTC